jgi:two-component sensor histidine kinase
MSVPFRIRSWSETWSRAQSRGFGWVSIVLILAGFLALLTTNGLSIWASNALTEQYLAVQHSRDVRRALDLTERSIVDAVAAERGFLLVGSANYRQAEAEARHEIMVYFGEVRALLLDDPELLRRLDDTRPLIDESMGITQQVVRDMEAGRFNQALAVLRSSRSTQVLSELEARFDAIDHILMGRLDEGRRAAERARQINLWFSSLASVLIVLVAALAIFQFSRSFQAIRQAHSELDDANRDLERRVDARTQDLVVAHAEVERSRDRAEAMLREVNHRVGNSLQLVSSFITLQGRTIRDTAALEAFRATQARIEAVSRVHRQLYTSDNMGRVELDSYLTGLVDELRQSLCPGERACSLTVEAEPLTTSTDRTVAVGVLVAELVTNAVKYAYPDGSGEIRVRLVRDGDNRARLTVEDDGVGVGEGAASPKGTGLGKTIIAAMARDLRTEVAYVYGPVGLSASLVFDL